MQICLSFNPVSELSWIKKHFFDDPTDTLVVYGEEQASQIPRGTVNKYRTFITHSTFLDNHFIDDEYKREMEELKKYDENEYNIYALGMWGTIGGTFFSKANISKRIKEVMKEKPLKKGYFEFEWNNADTRDKILDDTITWIDDEDGYIKIIEEPKDGFFYVGGGDTAGEGSDWNTGCFTNNVTGDDVASVRINFDEDLYAQQMYCLGRYYNNALLGIETNFSTHPNKELERLGYHNLYIREESPDKITNKLVKRYGFQTNKATRPLALGMLRTLVRENPERIKDIDTLEEMSVFAKNEKGKPEAPAGHHDDMIMARAINAYISKHQKSKAKIAPPEKGEAGRIKDEYIKRLKKKKKYAL